MLTELIIADVPAVALLQDISRSLLTLGVGLFLGYVVLIISANLFGLVPRYTAKLTNRQHRSTSPAQPQLAARTTAQRSDIPVSSVALKEEIS